MESKTYNDIQESATRQLEEFSVRRDLALKAVRDEINKATIRGDAVILTNEEIAMIKSFRSFKGLMKTTSGIFKWQTVQTPGVIEAPERVHIADPSEDLVHNLG